MFCEPLLPAPAGPRLARAEPTCLAAEYLHAFEAFCLAAGLRGSQAPLACPCLPPTCSPKLAVGLTHQKGDLQAPTRHMPSALVCPIHASGPLGLTVNCSLLAGTNKSGRLHIPLTLVAAPCNSRTSLVIKHRHHAQPPLRSSLLTTTGLWKPEGDSQALPGGRCGHHAPRICGREAAPGGPGLRAHRGRRRGVCSLLRARLGASRPAPAVRRLCQRPASALQGRAVCACPGRAGEKDAFRLLIAFWCVVCFAMFRVCAPGLDCARRVRLLRSLTQL